MRLRRHLPCLLLLPLAACNGSDSIDAIRPSQPVTGVWRGTIESPTDGPGVITLELRQTSRAVTGSIRLSQSIINDVPGPFVGTLEAEQVPTSLSFVVTYVYGSNDCRGSFSGTLRATSSTMEGPYNGQDCAHSFAGTLRVRKD